MNPLVSVIIPAYNAESYILETLFSVYKQSLNEFEIIVVNDGSTDSTRAIVEDQARKHPFLSLVNKDNSGVADSRNVGIQMAKGNYIALLDSDDTWDSKNLENKISFLQKNPDYSWVYCNLLCIADNGGLIGEHPEGRDDNILENILKWEGEVVPGPCSNIVFSASLKNEIEFDINLSTAADQDFCLQLAQLSKGKCLKDRLVNYRVLENSMSRDISVMEKDHIAVFKKADQNKLFKSKWFKRRCFSNLYKILAGSWWHDGGKKFKGLKFVFKSILIYPPIVRKYFT